MLQEFHREQERVNRSDNRFDAYCTVRLHVGGICDEWHQFLLEALPNFRFFIDWLPWRQSAPEFFIER
jgi:hypothetical protein